MARTKASELAKQRKFRLFLDNNPEYDTIEHIESGFAGFIAMKMNELREQAMKRYIIEKKNKKQAREQYMVQLTKKSPTIN